jgi:hypothetical protein
MAAAALVVTSPAFAQHPTGYPTAADSWGAGATITQVDVATLSDKKTCTRTIMQTFHYGTPTGWKIKRANGQELSAVFTETAAPSVDAKRYIYLAWETNSASGQENRRIYIGAKDAGKQPERQMVEQPRWNTAYFSGAGWSGDAHSHVLAMGYGANFCSNGLNHVALPFINNTFPMPPKGQDPTLEWATVQGWFKKPVHGLSARPQ